MWVKTSSFLSLVFAALALAPAMAHVLELPNKINLSREDYLTVQHIYRGWAFLGFVVAGALLSTLALTLTVRKEHKAFMFAFIALLCMAGTQVVFWTYTYPANQATHNWTMLPDNWVELRRQWEYAHATSAVLHFVALVMLIVSVLARKE